MQRVGYSAGIVGNNQFTSESRGGELAILAICVLMVIGLMAILVDPTTGGTRQLDVRSTRSWYPGRESGTAVARRSNFRSELMSGATLTFEQTPDGIKTNKQGDGMTVSVSGAALPFIQTALDGPYGRFSYDVVAYDQQLDIYQIELAER